MKSHWVAIFLLVLPIGSPGLQCRKGISVFGQFVRGDIETCKNGASCFYASAQFSPLVTVQLSSCSRVRCKAIGSNNCGNITIKGVNFKACCCSSDFCKARAEKKGFIENVTEKFSKMREVWKIVTGSG